MRRYLSVFLLVVTAILIAVTYYLHRRIGGTIPLDAALTAVALLIWSLPVLHWNSRSEQVSGFTLNAQRASFLAMGMFSWLLVVTVFRDVVGLLGGDRWFEIARPEYVFAAASACCSIGYVISIRLRVKKVPLNIEGLPHALNGFRIVQISDLHVGAMIGRDRVEKVVAMIQSQRPDMVVMTGDIVDGNLLDYASCIEAFQELGPRGRVFFAPGNHEYYWNYEGWLQELSRRGVTILCNSGELFSASNGARVWVGGVTDPVAPGMQLGEAPNLAKAIAGGEQADLRVLLSHRPDPAEAAEKAGFQVQLSGHTHGGQFFPWTQIAKLVHKHFVGLIRVGKLWLYVSPGTGSWGPPLRFGTQPEVTVLELTGS